MLEGSLTIRNEGGIQKILQQNSTDSQLRISRALRDASPHRTINMEHQFTDPTRRLKKSQAERSFMGK